MRVLARLARSVPLVPAAGLCCGPWTNGVGKDAACQSLSGRA